MLRAAACLFLALLLLIVEAGTQNAHGLGLVFVLALFVLAGHHEAGGKMGDAHGESVVLTLCPPGPLKRETSSRRSLGDLDLHVVTSGSTATVTALVWMRPWISVAGTRCTR